MRIRSGPATVTPQGKSGDLKLMMGVMRGRYSSSLLSIFEEAVGLPFLFPDREKGYSVESIEAIFISCFYVVRYDGDS